MGSSLRIGDLARATETKVVTIRYYEQTGLLPAPSRSSNNYRTYGRPELERLAFIRRARDLGFSLEQVRSLLSLANDRGHSCDDVDRLARQHLEEIEHKLDDLIRLRDELRQTIGNCRNNTIADCRILKAFGSRASG